jgi:hypothetical protein
MPTTSSSMSQETLVEKYIKFSKDLDGVSYTSNVDNDSVPENPVTFEISNLLENVSIVTYLNTLNNHHVKIEDYINTTERETYLLTRNLTGGPIVAYLVLIILLLLKVVTYDSSGMLIYNNSNDNSSPLYNMHTFGDVIKFLPHLTTKTNDRLGYSVYKSNTGLLLIIDTEIESGPIQRYLTNTTTSNIINRLKLLNTRNTSYLNSNLGTLINSINDSNRELIKNTNINPYNYLKIVSFIRSKDSLEKSYIISSSGIYQQKQNNGITSNYSKWWGIFDNQ